MDDLMTTARKTYEPPAITHTLTFDQAFSHLTTVDDAKDEIRWLESELRKAKRLAAEACMKPPDDCACTGCRLARRNRLGGAPAAG